MKKLADISMFENLQNAANRSMTSQMAVFNAFSKEEKEQKAKRHFKEMLEIKEEYREISEIANLLGTEPQAMGELGERYNEIVDRFEILKGRLEQLKSEDTEGAFIDHCLDIEEQLNEFKSKIMKTPDAPPEQVRHLRNTAKVE